MTFVPTVHTVSRARHFIERIKLDLSGLVVYTEAATGAYCLTAGLAAMSGARQVFALAKDSQYGSAQDAAKATLGFAKLASVEERVKVVFEKRFCDLMQADIVTNSGHVRPIDEITVSALKSTAVIPLMYEAWEFRSRDVDLDACRNRGIPVAGTNEGHPQVGILKCLGMMALKLLLDGGIEVVDARIALWSDNKFCTHIANTLSAAGAVVLLYCPSVLQRDTDGRARLHYLGELRDLANDLSALRDTDAILLVVSPKAGICIGEPGQALISSDKLALVTPGATIAQFWGQVDRSSLVRAGLRCIPMSSPLPGHMGVLPSDLGFMPVLRLQVGGLKVGEIMARARLAGATPEKAQQMAVDAGFGQVLMI
jgi:hypothetical protein